MWSRFWMDKEKLDKVVMVFQEHISLLVDRANILKTGTEEQVEIWRGEMKRIREIQDLREALAYAVNGGDTQATENEQLEAIRKWMNEVLIKEARHGFYDKDLVKVLQGYFKDVLYQKEKAYGIFASLADDMRVKLLAVQFLLEQARYAGTHREKNGRIQTTLETINVIVENLGRIDKGDPQSYEYVTHTNVGDWSYIRTLRDMHYQKQRLQTLEEENTILKQKIEELETETVKEDGFDASLMDEQDIPF